MEEKMTELGKLSKAELRQLVLELLQENETLKTENEKTSELYEKANATALKVSEMSNAYNRMLAEFENARKRNLAQVEKSKTEAVENLAKEILPVLDNFTRAIESIKDGRIKSGVEMIFNQLQNTLNRMGVERFESLGEMFDHNLHDAIMTEPGEENKIVKVFLDGYKCGEKVIRPAQVAVGKTN